MDTQAAILELLAKMYEPKPDYLAKPGQWVEDVLGEHLWSKQDEIMRSVRDNKATAVQSCHDAGKSYIASRIAAWWLSIHPVGEAVVVSTAPTAHQVAEILWSEIAIAHAKGGLPGKILAGNTPKWTIEHHSSSKPITLGMGRKPSDYNEHAFQGIHRRYVLVIVDEACGVPPQIWNAVDAITTNKTSRILAIGNPDDPSTHFAKLCAPNNPLSSGWHNIRIDGLQTPNLCQSEIDQLDPELREAIERVFEEAGLTPTREEVPEALRDVLLSCDWVARQAIRWGTSSALWTSKIRGLFPDANDDSVVPLGWVERAIDRYRDWVARGAPYEWGRVVISVDPAATGKDRTCIAMRRGDVLEKFDLHAGINTVQTTKLVRAAAKIDENNQPGTAQTMIIIDAGGGYGNGTIDQLREDGVPGVIAFVPSGQDGRKDEIGEYGFLNNRAAMWWNIRELLGPGGDPHRSTVMLPDSDEIREDLTAPKYKVAKTGSKIQVEEKDEIRKRLGRSTDVGDAVCMAFYHQAVPVDATSGGVIPWSSAQDDQWVGSDPDVAPWG